MQNTFFDWPVRVYYEDTDAAGVVYYANYLRYMERARTEWLRALGWEQDAMREKLGVVFVVAAVEAKYRLPARLDDALVVRCRVESLKKASLVFSQDVMRGSEVLVHALIKCGTLDFATMRPTAMPETLFKQLNELQ
jgi:acyl-CoA thioester hydrolase